MKRFVHLSFSYLKYYKKQTAALLMGVIFSAALFTGMGSLFESGKQAAVEHARAEYGDWHYNTRGDLAWIKDFEKEDQGRGYKIEKIGMETIRKVLEEPFKMQLVYADSSYLEMMGRKILQGYYPQTEQEIAMDMQTLQSLGMEDKLGEQVVLDRYLYCMRNPFGYAGKIAGSTGKFQPGIRECIFRLWRKWQFFVFEI